MFFYLFSLCVVTSLSDCLPRCLTYVREAAQRAAAKSELHKSQIEKLLNEKVSFDRMPRAVLPLPT